MQVRASLMAHDLRKLRDTLRAGTCMSTTPNPSGFSLRLMQITYFGHHPPHPGGVAQHGQGVVAGLRAREHQLQVLSWRRMYPARLYPGTVAAANHQPAPGVTALADWFDPTSWLRVGWRAAAGDLLVLPWVTAFHAPASAAVLRAAGDIARVAIVHNARPHERQPGSDTLLRTALRPLDGAVVHATSVADDLNQLLPHLPITVVEHPANLPLVPMPLPVSEPLRLLVFGFVRAYKGVEVALDAVQLLVRDGVDVRLTIAGEFWEPIDQWRAAVASRGLASQVELRAGYVPDDEVQGLFSAHHLLVAPYHNATQSGIVPLARAAGRGVVVTRVGGLAEAVTDGTDGRLVPPGDPIALASALQDGRREAGRWGQRSAQRQTRWEDVADAITAHAH